MPNFNHYVWDAVAVYNESIHVLVMSIAPPLYIQTILALERSTNSNYEQKRRVVVSFQKKKEERKKLQHPSGLLFHLTFFLVTLVGTASKNTSERT